MIEMQNIKRINYAKNLKSKKSKIRNFLLMNHIIYRENNIYKIEVRLNNFGILFYFLKSFLWFLYIFVSIIPFILWVGLKEVFEDFNGFIQSLNFIQIFKDLKKDSEYNVDIKKDFESIENVKKELCLKEEKWVKKELK